MKKSILKLFKLLGFKLRPLVEKSVEKNLKKTLKFDYAVEAYEQI